MRREPLSGCSNLAFERMVAVWGFASFRGQRNRPDLWWVSRTGEHVGHESWLERDRLMALDADSGVVGGGQPIWPHWAAESGRPPPDHASATLKPRPVDILEERSSESFRWLSTSVSTAPSTLGS
jgi:hypothetical protein